MSMELTQESYDEIIRMEPQERIREKTGDYIEDTINGILVGFSYCLQLRGGWVDMITLRDAEREIKELMIECRGNV